MFEGKTSNYITIAASSDEDLSGCYKSVIIDGLENGIAMGHIEN